MANYATLKTAIQQVVKTNGNEEITGALLQQSLLAMINSLGGYYQFAGIATPSTNPGTPDQNVFYIASESGTYSNFGGLAVSDGEVAIFKYNGTWTKGVTGAATAAQVTQLGQEVDGIDTELYGGGGPYTEGAYLNNNLKQLVIGNITRGITPLIPAVQGDKVLFHVGLTTTAERLWLYGTDESPLTGAYYNPASYQSTPLTIDNANAAYVRTSFNMLAEDVYVSINGVKVWAYKKKVIGLAEWNYKAVGIRKAIYDVGTFDCWAAGYVSNTNGSQSTSSMNSCTGFIDVEEFEMVETVMSIVTSSTSNAAVCFYASDGTFISAVLPYVGAAKGYETRVLNVPYGAKYIRNSIYSEYRQYWKLIGIRTSHLSGRGGGASKPQKVTLEFGALGADGQMKPYSADFFDNARTPLYYRLQSVNLPYDYTIYVYNSAYSLVDTISAQANEEYILDSSMWHKVVINYTANSLPKKKIVIDLDVIGTSYNIIPAKTIKTFQYLVRYKKGRGLYVDNDTSYSEAGGFEDTLISNTLRLYLPSNYSPTGEPIKMIYKAHGTNGYSWIDLDTWGGDSSINYLADEGFAIYDMFAGTSYYSAIINPDLNQIRSTRIANYNTPLQLAAQSAAYEWVVRNFNIDPYIYVFGKSHGGLAGIYATNKIVPTRAVALFAPLITQIGDRYHPWGIDRAETSMCLDDMCFDTPAGVSFNDMVETVFYERSGWKTILSDNLVKQAGLNPYINGITNAAQATVLDSLMNNDYKTVGGMDNLIRHSDIPVKVWCAPDDDEVLFANGWNFIKSLQNGGSYAQFREFPTGTGGHYFDSFTDANSIKDTVTTALGVQYTASRAYIEAVNFFNQFG